MLLRPLGRLLFFRGHDGLLLRFAIRVLRFGHRLHTWKMEKDRSTSDGMWASRHLPGCGTQIEGIGRCRSVGLLLPGNLGHDGAAGRGFDRGRWADWSLFSGSRTNRSRCHQHTLYACNHKGRFTRSDRPTPTGKPSDKRGRNRADSSIARGRCARACRMQTFASLTGVCICSVLPALGLKPV
jgi:hypothetical protein